MKDLKVILKNLGFDKETEEEIMQMVENEIDIKELCKKIEYLQKINCDPRIIRIVIEENILFLSTELIEIQKVVEFIKNKGLEEYIVNMIEVNPDIVSVSVDTLEKNVNLLKLIFSDEKIKILLRDRIEFFTYNSDYLSKRLALLIENGLKEKLETIILTRIEIFDLEDDELDIDELKKNLK